MAEAGCDQQGWLRGELVVSWRELAVVLVTFTGCFFSSSLMAGIAHWQGHAGKFSESNHSMLRTASLESLMLAAMLAFLISRGWKLEDLRIRRGWSGTWQGLLMWVVWVGLAVGAIILEGKWHHAFPRPHLVSVPYLKPHLSLAVMILAWVVNAYYEEITMMAYAFNQFAAKLGPLVALALTVVLRLSFHLWKDPFLLGLTACHFFLAGCLYWRTRNLWPLILCHALFDILFSCRLVTEGK